jgi:hypothetical protein
LESWTVPLTERPGASPLAWKMDWPLREFVILSCPLAWLISARALSCPLVPRATAAQAKITTRSAAENSSFETGLAITDMR